MSGQEVTDPALLAQLNASLQREKSFKAAREKLGVPGFSGAVIHGIFGGLADKAAAAVDAAGNSIGNAVGLGSGQSFGDRYDQTNRLLKKGNAEYADKHPVLNTVGNVGGALLNPVGRGEAVLNLGARAARAAGMTRTAAKAAAAASRVEKLGVTSSAALTGANQGALTALGDTDSAGDLPGNVARGALLGGATGGAVGGVLGAVSRGLKPRVDTGLADAAAAAERLGVKPSLSSLTNSPALSGAANLSANLFGGGAIGRRALAVDTQLGGAVDNVADKIGNGATRFDAGQAAKSGIEGFADRFKAKANTLYSQVDKHIGSDHNVDLTDTILAMSGPVNKFGSNPELGQKLANSRLMDFASTIAKNPVNPGSLNFNEAQALRSEIGSMMGNSELINDIPRAQLSKVYGALTNDMRGSLQNAGNTEALSAFDRATNYYKAGLNRVNTTLDKIYGGASDAASNETVSNRVLNMVKNDANGTASLRRSLKPEEWDSVASSIFRRLGDSKPGASDAAGRGFSPSTFLTEFNKLQKNERAMNFAFGGTRYADLAPMYRDLGTVAERLRDNARFANTSRSGYYGSLAGLLGAAFVNPIAPIKAVAANKGFATLMASPKFLKWAVRAGRIVNRGRSAASPAVEAAARNHVAKLSAMYAVGTPEADALDTMVQGGN